MYKRQYKNNSFNIGKCQKNNSGLSELWLECARNGISEQPDIKTALQQLSVNPQDVECVELIINRLRAMTVQEILNPEPFRRTNPISVYKVSGPILLGKIRHSGVPWGIHQDALTEHLICVGRTGGGKTTIIKKILREILKRRKS